MARSTLAERMNRLEQQKARLAEEEARIRDQVHASRWPGAEPGIPGRSAGLLRDEENGRYAPI